MRVIVIEKERESHDQIQILFRAFLEHGVPLPGKACGASVVGKRTRGHVQCEVKEDRPASISGSVEVDDAPRWLGGREEEMAGFGFSDVHNDFDLPPLPTDFFFRLFRGDGLTSSIGRGQSFLDTVVSEEMTSKSTHSSSPTPFSNSHSNISASAPNKSKLFT